MSAVILADRDPLYAWFVTEALQAEGVTVTWFRSATPAVAWAAQQGATDRVLLVDAVTWLADRPSATLSEAGPRGAAVLLGWDTDRRPPEGFAIQREKPGDAAALRRLVAGAVRSTVAAPVERETPAGAAGPGGASC